MRPSRAVRMFALARAFESWDPVKHPRIPKGMPHGGEFLTLDERMQAAVHGAKPGGGHPLEGFSRPSLLKAAKDRGIYVRRGASEDELRTALEKDIKAKPTDAKVAGLAHALAHGQVPEAPAKKAAAAKQGPKLPAPADRFSAKELDGILADPHASDHKELAAAVGQWKQDHPHEPLPQAVVDAQRIAAGPTIGQIRKGHAAREKREAAKVTPAAPTDIAKQLADAKTREEAHALLSGMTTAQLHEVADELKMPGAKGLAKEPLRRRIVEFGVGGRLQHQEIMALDSGPVMARPDLTLQPGKARVAVDKMTVPQLRQHAKDNNIPITGARTKKHLLDAIERHAAGGGGHKGLGQQAAPPDQLDSMTTAKLLAEYQGKGPHVSKYMKKPEIVAEIRRWHAVDEPKLRAERAKNMQENGPYIQHLERVRKELPDRNYGHAVDEVLAKLRTGEYDRYLAYHHLETAKVMRGSPDNGNAEMRQGHRIINEFQALVEAADEKAKRAPKA